jgi:hypothetical protein
MKRYFSFIILLGCTLLFAFGIVQLFELRFEAGDVYPPYSSLRADPLGAMAFYESLGRMPGISVRRDFSTSNLLPQEPGTLYLHLAAETYEWDLLPEDLYHEIKNFLAGGGRLVITYFPQTQPAHRFFEDEAETNSVKSSDLKSKDKNTPSEKPSKKRRHLKGDTSWVDLEDEWGLRESFEELPQADGVYLPATVLNKSNPALPRSLDWHSGMVFTHCDDAWRTIYARGTNAVVLERKFGRGSVVVASDSYFVSNEALTRDRHAELLAWLVGANTRVVFDEAHLGILESPGVATLMRQYRLHGLAAGLLLLAGLFIWKNSTSLVPPPAEEPREDFVAGKDSASGFVNLLRRNILPRDVFEVCFAEWKKSVAPSGKLSSTRRQEAEAVFLAEKSLPAGQRNPIVSYKNISEILGNHRQKL